jgi:glycosyltransferase involved in cell wall biosynthesis
MSLPCFLAKKIFGIPYVIYCHGSDVYFPWRFKKIISKLVLENADAVIVLTENMKREVESFGFNIKNIFIIPNGVDLEKFKNLSKKDVRRELKINESENVALCVGTLKIIKGIKYLIEAINIVKNKGFKMRLLLIGEGDQETELKKMAERLNLKEDVNFIGKIENKLIPRYMAASDVFVLPSLSEGLPVVILEAMASGLPIIATDVRGTEEIVKNNENGFLVDPKNPDQISEKIFYLFSDTALTRKISIKNVEKAKSYSWDLITDKLLGIYSLCLKR